MPHARKPHAVKGSGFPPVSRSLTRLRRLRWPHFSGVEYTVAGVALLASSLLVRHIPALDIGQFDLTWMWGETLVVMHIQPVVSIGGWGGGTCIAIGVGKILFLEEYW